MVNMSLIYDIPLIWSFLLFVTAMVLLTTFGLFLFKKINIDKIKCSEHNGVVGILIGIMSVFLGVLLSFLIVTAWGIYSKAQVDSQREAQTIYILYELISTMPDTKNIQRLIIGYLEYIVNVEFPDMATNSVTDEGQDLIEEIQREIYNYIPKGSHDDIIYNRSVALIDVIFDLRINRLIITRGGLNQLMLWVTVVDCVLIIIMSWFLACNNLFHYLLVIIISIYVSSGLFTTLVLSNPFKGQFGLSSVPFQQALDEIKGQEII